QGSARLRGRQVQPTARAVGQKVVPGRTTPAGWPVSKAEFLRVFPSVYRGTHVGHRAVSMRRVRSVRLEAADVVAYADGERVGPAPVHCEVRPGALRVIV
ncbi:hypothetical protein AB0J09_53930, partial [Nonomuraea sp. NPDC049784]